MCECVLHTTCVFVRCCCNSNKMRNREPVLLRARSRKWKIEYNLNGLDHSNSCDYFCTTSTACPVNLACVCVCMWWSDFSYSVAPYHSWLLRRPFAKVHWTSIVALYSFAQVAHNKLFTSFTLYSRIRISETCWQLLDWIWNSFAILVAHI